MKPTISEKSREAFTPSQPQNTLSQPLPKLMEKSDFSLSTSPVTISTESVPSPISTMVRAKEKPLSNLSVVPRSNEKAVSVSFNLSFSGDSETIVSTTSSIPRGDE